MSEKQDPSDAHQMTPLLTPTSATTNGLECLRTIETLFVKQYPSLTEGKFSGVFFYIRIKL